MSYKYQDANSQKTMILRKYQVSQVKWQIEHCAAEYIKKWPAAHSCLINVSRYKNLTDC